MNNDLELVDSCNCKSLMKLVTMRRHEVYTVANTGLLSRSGKHTAQRRVPQGLAIAIAICTQPSDSVLQHTGGQICLIQNALLLAVSTQHREE